MTAMPMSEEERRRCILLGGCTEGVTREEALAQEIDAIRNRSAKPGNRISEDIAEGLLKGGFIREDSEQQAAPEESSAAKESE